MFAKRQSVGFNAAISVVTRTLGLILAFFNLGIITRNLNPALSGEYFTILAFIGIFNVFADLGLYQTLLREISDPHNDENSVFTAFFSLRLVSLLVVLGVLAPLAALWLPYNTLVKKGVILGSLLFICLSLITLFIAVFQKKLQMKVVAGSELASRVVQIILLYLFLQNGYGVYGALGAALLASTTQLGIIAIYTQKYIKFGFKTDWTAWRSILKVSYPIALSSIFSFIYFKLDSVMLSLFKSSYEVGIYGLAYKILEMLVAYPAIYVGIMVPILNKALATDKNRCISLAKDTFSTLALVALPMLGGGILLAPKIIPLFGSEYKDAVPALAILLGATFFIFFGTLYSNLLIIVHKQKTLAHIYFLGMVLNVLANLYVIPHWSYIGAAWTTLLTEGLVTLLMAICLKNYGFSILEPKKFILCSFSTIFMVLVLYFLPLNSLPVLLGVALVSYFSSAFAIGAL